MKICDLRHQSRARRCEHSPARAEDRVAAVRTRTANNRTVERPRPFHCGMTKTEKLAMDEHASPPSSRVPPTPVAPDSVSRRPDEI